MRLSEIAVRHGCELRGDPDAVVQGVATISGATPGTLTFLANAAYRSSLAGTKATAVVLRESDADKCNINCLITPNPYAVYASIAAELYPPPELKPGVHSSVNTGSGVHIPASCEIAAGVVIGDEVVLGEGVYIGPNCVIGNRVRIGPQSRLLATVTIYDDVRIGERVRVHAGTVIGADGFGIAQSATGWVKVPQIGGVVLGNDVEVGANCCIDRGAIEDTVLGNDVKLDNQVQIAHNVRIGDHTAIAGQSGVSGSTTIGARCMIGGSVAIAGHLNITDDVIILGRGSVSGSIASSGTYGAVFSVEEAGKWRRIAARVKRLDEMARRLRRVEQAIKADSASED